MFFYVLALFKNLIVMASVLPNIAIKEHHLFCNHSSGFNDFSIPNGNNNDFEVILMENLLINRDHSPVNKNKDSHP